MLMDCYTLNIISYKLIKSLNPLLSALKKVYAKNEAIFAYFVDTQIKHPGKITPSMILSLALNNSIKALGTEGKTFTELFGIKAFGMLLLDDWFDSVKVFCVKWVLSFKSWRRRLHACSNRSEHSNSHGY